MYGEWPVRFLPPHESKGNLSTVMDVDDIETWYQGLAQAQRDALSGHGYDFEKLAGFVAGHRVDIHGVTLNRCAVCGKVKGNLVLGQPVGSFTTSQAVETLYADGLQFAGGVLGEGCLRSVTASVYGVRISKR